MTMVLSTLSFFLSLIVIVATYIADAENGGFSMELIHRDSPKSPFYNPLDIPSDRVQNALRRSIDRARHFANPSSLSPQTAQSELISNNGEYLMNISIGTPPFPVLAIADTGSDIIWTQCEPCPKCYKQDAPPFAPHNSSTYKTISCSTRQCGILRETSCSEKADNCQYAISYGDGSYSKGELSTDTITLSSTSGRPVALPKTMFGCGLYNGGIFDKNGSGVIGLGGGAMSLVSQMGTSINGKFSYCLVPLTANTTGGSSKINFGSNAVVQGAGVVSTPLVKKDPDTFYFLTLEAITVDKERVELTGSPGSSAHEGNIVIDSGTTLTLLPADFYSNLEKAVSNKVNATPVTSPIQGLSLLCYKADDLKTVPKITVNFKDADVTLKPLNIFSLVTEDVACFAFSRTDSAFSIYGNLSQMDLLVGYDTEAGTVSFKPTGCTN